MWVQEDCPMLRRKPKSHCFARSGSTSYLCRYRFVTCGPPYLLNPNHYFQMFYLLLHCGQFGLRHSWRGTSCRCSKVRYVFQYSRNCKVLLSSLALSIVLSRDRYERAFMNCFLYYKEHSHGSLREQGSLLLDWSCRHPAHQHSVC